MNRIAKYLLLAAMVLMCFGSCRKGKVIPKKDFAAIYADMFLADQWLADNSYARRTADTTRFYDVIFEKYGYTFADYDASVNYYLNRPEKYRKILERTQQKLRATQKSLEEFQAKVDKQNKILEGLGYLHLPVFAADSVKVDTSMLWAPWRDTLTARRDSLKESRDTVAGDSTKPDRKHLKDSLLAKPIN